MKDAQKWPSQTPAKTPVQGQPVVSSMPSERPAANPAFGSRTQTQSTPVKSMNLASINSSANTKGR